MVTIKRILDVLTSMKKERSKWNRAVHDDAVTMIQSILDDGIDCEIQSSKQIETLMLSGAKDWKQYSYGCHGCSCVSDIEIANHYSTNTELKMTKGGLRRPNSRETWLDVQARGLFQSCYLVKNIYYSLMEAEQ